MQLQNLSEAFNYILMYSVIQLTFTAYGVQKTMIKKASDHHFNSALAL